MSGKIDRDGKKLVFCTLYEGDYHLGVAALLNSLHRHGFDGTFVVFHRGAVPEWIDQSARLRFRVEWREVVARRHLAMLKPWGVRQCFDYGADAAAYIDPDIVVSAPMQFFRTWLTDSVAVCQDMHWNMPAGHPTRRSWIEIEPRSGTIARSTYFNSGFLGVDRAYIDLLAVWTSMNDLIESHVGDAGLKQGEASSLFHSMDQDGLNMALGSKSWPIREIGPDAMGFIGLSPILAHAVGPNKPWRAGALRLALRGFRPSVARSSWVNAIRGGPIRPLSGRREFFLKFDLSMAAAVSRFYHR